MTDTPSRSSSRAHLKLVSNQRIQSHQISAQLALQSLGFAPDEIDALVRMFLSLPTDSRKFYVHMINAEINDIAKKSRAHRSALPAEQLPSLRVVHCTRMSQLKNVSSVHICGRQTAREVGHE